MSGDVARQQLLVDERTLARGSRFRTAFGCQRRPPRQALAFYPRAACAPIPSNTGGGRGAVEPFTFRAAMLNATWTRSTRRRRPRCPAVEARAGRVHTVADLVRRARPRPAHCRRSGPPATASRRHAPAAADDTSRLPGLPTLAGTRRDPAVASVASASSFL